MELILDLRDHIGSTPEKFYKSTLFENKNLLLGLNCLDPGQRQGAHLHEDQDKFYFVVEGEAEFELAGESHRVDAGKVVLAPANVEHGVTNRGDRQLVLLVGIAPWPPAPE